MIHRYCAEFKAETDSVTRHEVGTELDKLELENLLFSANSLLHLEGDYLVIIQMIRCIRCSLSDSSLLRRHLPQLR